MAIQARLQPLSRCKKRKGAWYILVFSTVWIFGQRRKKSWTILKKKNGEDGQPLTICATGSFHAKGIGARRFRLCMTPMGIRPRFEMMTSPSFCRTTSNSHQPVNHRFVQKKHFKTTLRKNTGRGGGGKSIRWTRLWIPIGIFSVSVIQRTTNNSPPKK